jgi:hypothetical protein
MRLRAATLRITGLLFSSALGSEAPRAADPCLIAAFVPWSKRLKSAALGGRWKLLI